LKQFSAEDLNQTIQNQFDTEFENIRIAVLFNAEHKKIQQLLSIDMVLATYLDSRARQQDAIVLFEHLLEILSNASDVKPSTQQAIGRLEGKVGNAYHSLGKSHKAQQYATSSLNILKSFDDIDGVYTAFHVLCLSNLFQGNYVQVGHVANEAITYFQSKNLLHKYVVGLHFLAESYFMLEDFESALEVASQMQSMEGRYPGGWHLLMAMIYDALNDFGNSEKYFEYALNDWMTYDMSWGLAITQMLWGCSEIRKQNLPKARLHFQQAFSVEVTRDSLIDMYVILTGFPALLFAEHSTIEAVKLLSFLEHVHIPISGFVGKPITDLVRKEVQNKSRNLLSLDNYNEAWEAGKSLTFEDMIQNIKNHFSQKTME